MGLTAFYFMTTLEESKNEVALKNGWNDWDSLVIWHHESGLLSELWEYIDEVAQEAAKSERNKTIEEIITQYVSTLPIGDCTAWDFVQHAKKFNEYLQSLKL